MNMITQLDEDKNKNKESVVKIKANLKPILAHYKVKATCKVGRLVGRVRHGVTLDIKSSPFDFLGAYAAKNKGFDTERGRLKLTANDDWSNWATGDMLKFLNATRDAIKDGFHDGFYDGVVTSVDHVDVTEYIEIHIGNFGTPYIIKEEVEMNMVTQLDEGLNKESVAKIKADLKPILAHYKVKATVSVRDWREIHLNIKSSQFDFLGAYADKNDEYIFKRGYLQMTANSNTRWTKWASGDMLKFLNAALDALKGGVYYDKSDALSDNFDVSYYIYINIGNFGTPYIIKEEVEMNTKELIEAVLYKKSYMVAEKIKELFEEKLNEKLDELQEEIVSEL